MKSSLASEYDKPRWLYIYGATQTIVGVILTPMVAFKKLLLVEKVERR